MFDTCASRELAINRWVEGFEAELREMLNCNAVMPTRNKKKYAKYCVIKEILG